MTMSYADVSTAQLAAMLRNCQERGDVLAAEPDADNPWTDEELDRLTREMRGLRAELKRRCATITDREDACRS